MNREENHSYSSSKCERLLSLTIFLLILISCFLHLCAFADLFFKNNEIDLKKNVSTNNLIKPNSNEIIDNNILPLFCIMAHLIWTIVPIVILDQCCLTNNKSIYQITLKLFICTIPLLLCSELSISYVYHLNYLKYDLLMISIKWLIFIGTILISFWTGILSDRNKWRGIHGGQIAPKQHLPLYLFQN